MSNVWFLASGSSLDLEIKEGSELVAPGNCFLSAVLTSSVIVTVSDSSNTEVLRVSADGVGVVGASLCCSAATGSN